ncbi:protein sym-1-like [Apium graveolens]|uniref:protein sym-1-like n=1 Tax=Apium graveolens TaxID=4045 RepID=UPI003D78CF04
MVLKPAIMSCKSAHILHFGSQTQIPTKPFNIPLFGAHSIFKHHILHGSSVLGRPRIVLRQIGSDYFRVSAVRGGGTGGGYSGGSGDGSSGDSHGDGDDKKWSLISWYLALLARHPVLTKSVTSAFLNLVGDLVCQLQVDHAPSLDLKRVYLFTFLGLALVGPTLHFWYLYLSKLVALPGVPGAFFRLVIDQVLFAPAFVGVFLSTLLTLEGRPSLVIPKLQQEWFTSVIANWKLWIPFQFLNFLFVPQQFQVLAANSIALIWNVMLSYIAHKEVVV